MTTTLRPGVLSCHAAATSDSGYDVTGMVTVPSTIHRAGTYLTDVTILEAQEDPLASLVANGVALETAVEISGVLYAYTIGSTIEEQSVSQAAEVSATTSPSANCVSTRSGSP